MFKFHSYIFLIPGIQVRSLRITVQKFSFCCDSSVVNDSLFPFCLYFDHSLDPPKILREYSFNGWANGWAVRLQLYLHSMVDDGSHMTSLCHTPLQQSRSSVVDGAVVGSLCALCSSVISPVLSLTPEASVISKLPKGGKTLPSCSLLVHHCG